MAIGTVNKGSTEQCLPLSGGTMQGKVLFPISGTDIIQFVGTEAKKDVSINFTRSDTGASINVGVGDTGDNMGIWDAKNGKWIVHTKASTAELYLGGTLCGGFIAESGVNYVRFTDGTQVCWFKTTYSSDLSSMSLQMSVPFVDAKYTAILSTRKCTNNLEMRVASQTASGIKIQCVSAVSSTSTVNAVVDGICIGRWK